MAEALVGGAFLSASLQVLFDRLASRDFINLFSRRKDGERLVKRLKMTLLSLKAVLNDAEDKQISNPAVNDWLDELKDAIYHADDLLDDIATKAIQSKLEAESQCSRNQVWNTISTFMHPSNEGIESRVEEIIDILEYFVKQKDILGLKEDVRREQLQRQRLQTSSLVDESGVYGRDKDKEKIIELLLYPNATSNNEIRVIPVVGMGGVGKTTLAQLVYNDLRVNQNFDMKAWVCVSDEFDVYMITKKLVKVVNTTTIGMEDLNQLQIMLKQSLKDKKFLVVLDDVWNDTYIDWDLLSKPFRGGAQEIKIIVTTRKDSVASIMGTVPSHRLKQLSLEDCWSLFAKHAFENGDYVKHPNLHMIGKEIVKKCKGLPLAVKSLGGVLRSKLDIEEWRFILKNDIWDLPSNILPALRLSYCYLPSHLKRCFAYCSIFHKDHKFEREKLVQLWIAEDLVQEPKGNKSLEDEGNNYFGQLLSGSFFQQFSDTSSYFVMHDLIHDLAQLMSGEFCFRLEDHKSHDISKKARHFSYVTSEYDAFKKFEVVNEVKCLRTFMSFKGYGSPLILSTRVLNGILPNLRCLRVLSLSHYYIFELPESIGNLIHLRYLDLSWTHIKRLPDSVTMLCNLQTLYLSHCELTELPEDMKKLINLRHLYMEGIKLSKMPIQMSRLKDLQHLTTFVVGKDIGSKISELGELCHLRGQLSILGLENVINGGDALGANIKGKQQLEKLVLKWDGSTNDSQKERDVLDNLQPHSLLKGLSIIDYMGTRFPDWLGDNSFCDIVSLRLEGCAYCFSLPPLGQLPSLKDLTISGMEEIVQVGREFYGDASSSTKPFQSLETLSFCDMPEWEEWHVLGVGEFSHLAELSIVNCPKLIRELPSQLPSLRQLKIFGCQRLVSNQVGLLQHLASLRNWTFKNTWTGLCFKRRIPFSRHQRRGLLGPPYRDL